MTKVRVVTLKVNKKEEHWQKLTLWYSYVFDHKMKTNCHWKMVEPIMELRKIGESARIADVAD